MTPESLIAFLVGVFVGGFVCRVWHDGRSIKTGQRPPPRQSPPAPIPDAGRVWRPGPWPEPPPMADTTYSCDEHYYGGCPNCGRGARKSSGPGQPDCDRCPGGKHCCKETR